MTGWLATFGGFLVAALALRVAVAAMVGEIDEWRAYQVVRRLVRRRAPAEVVAMRRPIEQVGADLRRLHAAFHRGGMRFAKYEGCRQAYDRVLAEAADMVGLTHLMELLPPGDELDHERERVELLLRHHGLLPPPYAA